jgi:hypothetical protein
MGERVFMCMHRCVRLCKCARVYVRVCITYAACACVCVCTLEANAHRFGNGHVDTYNCLSVVVRRHAAYTTHLCTQMIIYANVPSSGCCSRRCVSVLLSITSRWCLNSSAFSAGMSCRSCCHSSPKCLRSEKMSSATVCTPSHITT